MLKWKKKGRWGERKSLQGVEEGRRRSWEEITGKKKPKLNHETL